MPVGGSEFLSLHRARREALDEVALQKDEDDRDRDGRNDGGRHHIAPVRRRLAEERHHESGGQRPLCRVRDQRHGVEQVVPAPDEAVDRNGNHAGHRHREYDLRHDAPVTRAVDLRALDERIRNVVKIALQRPRADRQRKDHVADQQRPIAAEQSCLVHQRIDGQQQNCLRECLTHHEHAHDELPSAIAELCEAVSRECADDRRHQARPECRNYPTDNSCTFG